MFIKYAFVQIRFTTILDYRVQNVQITILLVKLVLEIRELGLLLGMSDIWINR